MYLGHYFPDTHVGLYAQSCGDGLCAKQNKTASEIAMRCRCIMYVSTQYDDVSCCCLIAKPIVRPSELPSDVRTSQLARSYS